MIWQVVVKQAVDVETKVFWQVFLLVWESNAHYFYNHRLLKNEKSKNQKNSKSQKNYHLLAANRNSRNIE